MVADTIAKVRLDRERKTLWQAGAARSGRTLSRFIRHACDDAARGLDSNAIRADVVVLRRYVNGIANEVASSTLDQETALRLKRDTAAMRAILDTYLSNR